MKKIITATFNVFLLVIFGILLFACGEIKYKVTFDADNGTTPTVVEVVKGKKVEEPKTNPEKSGFRFDYWALDDEMYDFDQPVEKDITLVAKWTELFTVTFDSAGGTAVASQSVAKNEKVARPTSPTKDGFIFKQWLLNGEPFDFDEAVTGNITLVAEWEAVAPDKVVVTFDANGGLAIDPVTIDKNSKLTAPDAPVREGFTFKQWLLNGEPFDFDAPITENITLVAEWNEVEVTFNTVGGTAIASRIVAKGSKLTDLPTPEKQYFTFEKWLVEGEEFDADSAITADIELYAQYGFVGIPDSPAYSGRIFNGDFDQLINSFESSEIMDSAIFENALIMADQPYISVGYSGEIGNNPDGALYKQAGSANNGSAAYQYLVLRIRGFAGASVQDLAIGFRYDDNHEVLVVPFTETLDPDLDPNTRELNGEWHNYVISIPDTLDGKQYIGKPGFNDVEATGVMVGFHLMNLSETGSGIIEIKDAYYSKLPNPAYPYEGGDYAKNNDYWFGTVGKTVSSYVVVQKDGYYGEYLPEDASTDNTHVVLRLRQESPGEFDLSKIALALVYEDGTETPHVAYSSIEGLPELGSSWLNVTIPFDAFTTSEDKIIAGYKLINNDDVDIAVSYSFLSYLGEYEAVEYPALDFENILVYDNFNRATIGATTAYDPANPVALENGFSYLISYSGLQSSTIGDGYITFDSTGGDFVSYTVHSTVKANLGQYKYLVFKYKLNDEGALDDFRMEATDYNDQKIGSVVYANQMLAGLGLPSIPEDMASYPYQDGDWKYLIVDLTLTPELSPDIAGFTLYYTGSSISIDAIFFANAVSNVDFDSGTAVTDFAGNSVLDEETQYEASFYDSPAMIVPEGDDYALFFPSSADFAQYWANYKVYGRYLQFDILVPAGSDLDNFRLAANGVAAWAKDGALITSDGLPLYVPADGVWHTVIIDAIASGLELTPYWAFMNGGSEVYIDNILFYNPLPIMVDEFVFADFESGNLSIPGENQYWQAGESTPANASVVADGDRKVLKLDGSAYVQYATGIKGTGDFFAFDIKLAPGSDLANLRFMAGTDEAIWVKDGKIVLADGTVLTVDAVPDDGEWHHLVIQWTGSGFAKTDTLRICLDGNSVIYFDNLAWWQTPSAPVYPVLTEDFATDPVNDGTKYWWGVWEAVNDEQVELVTADYMTLRFGSPLITGARYLSFDVKLASGENGEEFRLELGDQNIVYWSALVSDNVASPLTEDVQRVTIDLSKYTAINGLQVLGFHINAGGVVIDNIEVSKDAYGFQMSLFSDE